MAIVIAMMCSWFGICIVRCAYIVIIINCFIILLNCVGFRLLWISSIEVYGVGMIHKNDGLNKYSINFNLMLYLDLE